MKIVGEVHEVQGVFEWRIDNYFSLSKENCDSPYFFVFGKPCHLRIISQYNGDIDLYFFWCSPDTPITLTYTLALKTVNKTKVKENRITNTFQGEHNSKGKHKIFTVSELFENQSELVPSGILTIVFTLEKDDTDDEPRLKSFGTKIVGEVRGVQGVFEWRIHNYFSHSKKNCDSPSFFVVDEPCHLRIISQYNGDIDLYFFWRSPDTPITLTYTLALKTVNKTKVKENKITNTFQGKHNAKGKHKIFTVSELFENQSEWVPSGILTIVFTLEKADTDDTTAAECSNCKTAFDAEVLSFHKDKCVDKPLKCPMCNKFLTLRECCEHECLTATSRKTEKLISDFAAILKNQEHSDVTIKVKNKEFRLHKNILAGRNSFFRAMFTTEMRENITGIVSIEDCEPDVFELFLNFLYTGKIQALSKNACALYEAADKYQEDQLKAKCLSYMKYNLSVDNFCDITAIAVRHQEKKLLQAATKFFCKNTKKIIQSGDWQNFITQYPTQANEVHIKALDYNAK